MPENEFEKKVSSELQELRFKPSETVWMKVEERIRKKNKRKVFIILFLLAGIALLGYWQWDNFFGEKKGDIVKTEEKNTIENKDKVESEATKTNTEKNNTSKEDQNIKKENALNNNKQEERTDVRNDDKIDKKIISTDISTSKTDKNVPINNTSIEKASKKKQTILPTDKNKNKPNPEKGTTKPIQKREVVKADNDLAVVTTDETAVKKDNVEIRSISTDSLSQQPFQDIKSNENKTDSIKADPIVKKDDSKKDSVVKKVDSLLKALEVDSPIVNHPKRSFDKKWKFGIEFIPGYSSFHEDVFFLSLDMSKSADLNASPVGGGSSSAAPSGPVKSHSGFAFQFGGFFKKQFTPRSSFTVGLRWAYYSEELRIGIRMIPSAQSPAFQQLLNALGATSAYDAGGLNYYATNNYHFFEVPLNYNVRINKNEAHPLNLQAGIKIGQMFTSNALVYDTVAGGIYYDSKKYFNKTQFGISTSLNWKITKKDKFYMAIGPVFDFHLNSLLDNPFDKKKYLLFSGLRTTVIFNSKK